MRKILAVLMALLTVASLAIGVSAAKRADMSGYKLLKDPDHVFISVSPAEVQKMQKSKKTFVLYCGRSTCPHCYQAVPVLNDVAKKNRSKVYYVDVTQPGYLASLMKMFPEYVKLDEQGKDHFYVPQVFFLKQGRVVYNVLGAAKGYNPSRDGNLGGKQKAALAANYQKGFQQIA